MSSRLHGCFTEEAISLALFQQNFTLKLVEKVTPQFTREKRQARIVKLKLLTGCVELTWAGNHTQFFQMSSDPGMGRTAQDSQAFQAGAKPRLLV